MYPELGMYHFLFDRPFLGRFPITTFSWFNDQWFLEYLQHLKSKQAKYIVIQKDLPKNWYQIYLGYAPNIKKFDQMNDVIKKEYQLFKELTNLSIYKRK